MVGRSTREIERALLRKGFAFRDNHHRFLHFLHHGEPTGLRTHLSHGVDEYGASLLAKVSKQLYLSKAELLRLIDCEMSGEEYAALLAERGILG